VITGTLIGDKALIARLGAIPAAMKAEVDLTVQRLGYELEARVKRDQLTGRVLKVRTGRLRSSIGHGAPGSVSRQETTPSTSIYYVGTNVSYGVAWERGIAAKDIVPVRAKALRFMVGGEVIFRKRVHIPAQAPRQFLEPALFSMRPLILSELGAALRRGATKALGA
jgi:hypothetical protein